MEMPGDSEDAADTVPLVKMPGDSDEDDSDNLLEHRAIAGKEYGANSWLSILISDRFSSSTRSILFGVPPPCMLECSFTNDLSFGMVISDSSTGMVSASSMESVVRAYSMR